MVSLKLRLIMASAVVLPICLGFAGAYLDRAHQSALDAASTERLQLQVLTLIAQAEFDDEFSMPRQPLGGRLSQPRSGLYAMVMGGGGQVLWLSPSAALLDTPASRLSAGMPALEGGDSYDSESDGLFRHAYQVIWELPDGSQQPLRFIVAESTSPRDADLDTFRQRLWLGLGLSILLLLAVQMGIVRWGLRPLTSLSREIAKIEAGNATGLSGAWPPEVDAIAVNLQILLDGEQQRRERLRNTLADLAHTLKTPLAVLNSADPDSDDYCELRNDQIARMNEVISWQLQRATVGQHRPLHRVKLRPVLERLHRTLSKVYVDRSISIEIQCAPHATYRGDERDLLELMGNLMDNACKYGRSCVLVRVLEDEQGSGLVIDIEDDGDGISPELRDSLLQRGARADSRQEGQGIGLTLSLETVRASGGALSISDSSLGGAKVTVRFASI